MPRTLLALALLTVAACTRNPTRGGNLTPIEVAPLDALHFEEFVASNKGSVLVINFWATWCHPCVKELPDLARFHAQFSARGVSVVGISVDDSSAETVGRFAAQRKIPYTVLLLTSQLAAASQSLARVVPTTYIFDREGRLRKRVEGPLTFGELEQLVAPLL